jgi:hypothetical protein
VRDRSTPNAEHGVPGVPGVINAARALGLGAFIDVNLAEFSS